MCNKTKKTEKTRLSEVIRFCSSASSNIWGIRSEGLPDTGHPTRRRTEGRPSHAEDKISS